ncbi:MAG: hypothetical protein GY866_09690 [Proteobacteria bacterium]|nr:hypothetical protein [Pseudomonadota bacterium]
MGQPVRIVMAQRQWRVSPLYSRTRSWKEPCALFGYLFDGFELRFATVGKFAASIVEDGQQLPRFFPYSLREFDVLLFAGGLQQIETRNKTIMHDSFDIRRKLRIFDDHTDQRKKEDDGRLHVLYESAGFFHALQAPLRKRLGGAVCFFEAVFEKSSDGLRIPHSTRFHIEGMVYLGDSQLVVSYRFLIPARSFQLLGGLVFSDFGFLHSFFEIRRSPYRFGIEAAVRLPSSRFPSSLP